MRTTLTLLTLGLTLSLGACEFYDCGPGCDRDCDPWDDNCEWDDDWGDDDPWGDDDDDDDPEADADTDVDADTDTDTQEDPPAADIQFELTPSEAEQGETFIASLAMGGEDSPGYDAISSVTLYGDITVLASDVRGYEVLLSIAVDADGEGAADLLVEFEDGEAVWAEDILTIWPAGSGHEAGDSGEPDPCE